MTARAGVLATAAAGLSASLAVGGSRSGGTDHRGLSPAALLLDDRTCALVETCCRTTWP